MKEALPQVDWQRVDTAIGKDNRELLHASRVVVIGTGSLGGEITHLLSMAGVGHFTLVDPDTLSPANVVRHPAGLSHLGRYKVAALRDLVVHERNPQASVFAVAADARTQPRLITHAADLAIISGLGSHIREAEIANTLRLNGIPTLVAGVYPGATGGEIFHLHPDSGPCYSCITSFLGKTAPPEVRQRAHVYGLAPDEIAAAPGLALHINLIAALASDLALTRLLHRPLHPQYPQANLLLFATQDLPQLGQFSLNRFESQWFAVPQNPDCHVCSSAHTASSLSLTDLQKGGDQRV